MLKMLYFDVGVHNLIKWKTNYAAFGMVHLMVHAYGVIVHPNSEGNVSENCYFAWVENFNLVTGIGDVAVYKPQVKSKS